MRALGAGEFLFLLEGFKWTVMLSVLGFFGGTILGLALALMRVSAFRALRYFSIGVIELFQNTPLLLQLFVVYFGAVFLRIPVGPFEAVTFGLCLHAGALLGEAWRGTIQAVPRGQWEASAALGLSYYTRMRYVILPQAFKISLPPTVGILVQIIKGTSLAALVGFIELTRAGQMMSNATFRPMLIYAVVALLYFALCWPLSLWSARLERRLAAPVR